MRRSRVELHRPNVCRFGGAVLGCLMLIAGAGCGLAPVLDTPVVGQVTLQYPQPVADLRADVNRDGVVSLTDAADDADEETWSETHGAIFLANIDVDDMSRCTYSQAAGDDVLAACNDASDEAVNGADDVDDLAVLQVAPWPEANDSATATVTVTADAAASSVRLFKKTANWYELFRPETDQLTGAELRSGVELRLEGKDVIRDPAKWDGFATLTLTVKNEAGSAQDAVKLKVAPVIFFHHLTPAKTAFVTRVPAGGYGRAESTTFVTSLRSIMTGAQAAAPLVEIGTDDIWAQDFFENAYMSMPSSQGQHVMRVKVRSANVDNPRSTLKPLRPAGRFVFTSRGPGEAALQQYVRTEPYEEYSLNSTGNFETIPPFELDGVKYPLGRVLRGNIPSFHPDPSFLLMVESQKVQSPVYIDTSWLLVGHVDETISFIKVNSPRGWALLINDAHMAIQMLQDLVTAQKGDTQMFVGKNWPPVDPTDPLPFSGPAAIAVKDVLNDTEVISESTAAAAHVDAQLAIIKQATGLTDDEIIHVPFLHMPLDGASLAYQPGMVNGFYVNATTFIAPNPYGPVVDGKDIFANYVEQQLAARGVTVKWLDDWDLYHVNMGEVHCGTNAAREIPEARWWEAKQ